MDKHDLGIHSEMLTNSMADLVEAGVITGKKKSLHRGKIVGTFAYGTQRLYDLLDNNPGVELLRGSYVNDPWVVAQNDNFVSINACMSVDLTGQVCSESIGSRQYSGTGGQADMAVGASHAKNGRNIIVVPATKKGRTISSITPTLSPGSVVSLSRNQVDCIITEYGTAWLKGRNVRQRVENLIAVAAPEFRGELRREAERLRLW
jgi:acyl-CoA hydrolase